VLTLEIEGEFFRHGRRCPLQVPPL
jgi:hypothetical protein